MFKDLLKYDHFPTTWCPGCGIGLIMIQLAKVLDELGWNYTNTVLVNGIGCTGHLGEYLKFDSVYTLHGRTVPVAEGIKLANPALNVVVVSGDGDLASIGGNHLLHTIRRNTNIKVVCNNNEVYALTGGHMAPTAHKGAKTLTSPEGAPFEPVNLQNLLKTGSRYFYAKTDVYHIKHFQKCLREAFLWDGFAFVDVTSQCIENYGRRLGYKTGTEMLVSYRKKYKRPVDGADFLAPDEIGILKKGNGAGEG